MFGTNNIYSIRIILILLVKAVILYIRFLIIQIQNLVFN